MSQVSEMDFTDEDFKLIEDGLSNISKYDGSGSAYVRLLMNTRSLPQSEQHEMETRLKEMEDQAKKEHQEKVDGITILRYKLVQFKRYLRENATRHYPPFEPVSNEAETPVSAH